MDVRMQIVLSEFQNHLLGLARQRVTPLAQFVRTLAENYCLAYEGVDDHTFQGEVWVLDKLRKVVQDDSNLVFIDVGALYGDWSVFVRERFPTAKIIAVEMDPRGYARLSERFADDENVVTVHAAVYLSDDEEVTFAAYDRPEISTLLSYPYPGTPRREKVKTIRGDTLVRRYVPENYQIAYVKVDAEGVDYAVVSSFTETLRERAPWCIQFEYGPMHIEARTFLKDFYTLLGRDYNLGKIYYPGGVVFRPYDYSLENFWRANWVAVHRSLLGLTELLQKRGG